ncbi:MAG: heme-degrading monooxygenase HmoA [Alcanivorax sp.]|jgi:heme-degrading monooxygenase HmoA
MYAVIFTATLKQFDQAYSDTAEKMRELAFKKYGCREFTSVAEGDQEVAISYWDSQEQIRAWKQDPAHQAAQQRGQEQWYTSYKVQVVKVVREYGQST